MLAHEFQGLVSDKILRIHLAHAFTRVAFQLEALVIVVEVGREVRVCVTLAIVAEEVIEAVLQRAA